MSVSTSPACSPRICLPPLAPQISTSSPNVGGNSSFLSPSPALSNSDTVPPSPNPSCSSVHCSSSSLSSGSTVVFNLSREPSNSTLGGNANGQHSLSNTSSSITYTALSPDDDDFEDDGDDSNLECISDYLIPGHPQERKDSQVTLLSADDRESSTMSLGYSSIVHRAQFVIDEPDEAPTDRSYYERLHDSPTEVTHSSTIENKKQLNSIDSEHQDNQRERKEDDVRPKYPPDQHASVKQKQSTETPRPAPTVQQRKLSHELMPSQCQHSLDPVPQQRKFSLENLAHPPPLPPSPSSMSFRGQYQCVVAGLPPKQQQQQQQQLHSNKDVNTSQQQTFPRIFIPLLHNLNASELEQRLLQHQHQLDTSNDGPTSHNPGSLSRSALLPPTLTISTSTPLLSPQHPTVQGGTPSFLLTPTNTRTDLQPPTSPYSYPSPISCTPPSGVCATPRPKSILTSLLPPPTATTSPSPSSPSSISSCSSSSSSSSLTVGGEVKRRSSHGLDLADISEEPQYENTIIRGGENTMIRVVKNHVFKLGYN